MLNFYYTFILFCNHYLDIDQMLYFRSYRRQVLQKNFAILQESNGDGVFALEKLRESVLTEQFQANISDVSSENVPQYF